jgi:glycosyltransferase 2 family protein
MALVRLLVTLAVLALVLRLVDVRAVGARLRHLDVRWSLVFIALSLPLYLLSAWRWCFTAARLGAPLRFRRAWLEYYVSTLLNQVLPFGVAGDVVRAARHRGRLTSDDAALDDAVGSARGSAVRAVILERLSGFVALGLFVVASGLLWVARGRDRVVLLGVAVVVTLVLLAFFILAGGARAREGSWLAALASDGRRALFGRGAIAFQLAISTLSVALLIAMFSCAGRATGVSLDPILALQIVPLVLACTTVPWAFAGWGVREAAMAALYQVAGLDAAAGVAVSIAFGLLILLAATPGLVVLALPARDRVPA